MNFGKKHATLQYLNDLMISKRYRAWSKNIENIIFKFMEFCVGVRCEKFFKDGDIQYCILFQ